MRTTILHFIAVVGVLAAGCAQKTTNIDVMHDDGKAVMALDYRDFDQAASKMVQSMLGSGALKKQEGGRYVVATGRIINDTTQRIDTDQLMVKIETEILNSGQAVMTSAIGSGSDELLHETRELRDSEEFDPDTVAKRQTLIAPELTISGKIFQRNIRYDRNTQQVEYYFQLKLSDVKSGLRFWQDETLIGKRGSSKSVSW
ncbi:MAG: penicillin-binding protein activator LpoB [Planctomycetes bacterium B3_Pla]|nr:MAG: penicillin-binding protein activator LpoB [Planctomycetes bacterium B3_Pla]